MLAEMTDGMIGVCKRLVMMSDRVSPDIILKDTSEDARDEVVSIRQALKYRCLTLLYDKGIGNGHHQRYAALQQNWSKRSL